jgi:hypothetical protein
MPKTEDLTHLNYDYKWKSYKDIRCDGFGCSKEATERINISAGIFGKIPLNLCPDCIKLFENPNLEI